MNLGTLLEMVAVNAADRVVLGSLDGGTTGSRLRATAVAGAHALRAADPGTVVFVGEGGPPFAAALLASAVAGIPFLPLNYRLTAPQLAEVVGRHPGAWVIADDPSVIGESAPNCRALHSSGSWLDVCDRPTGEPAWAGPADDDVAVLLMTSGTTAAPKSAVLRHKHLTSYVLGSVELGSAEPDEAVIVSVPPYHIAAVANLLSNLYRGRRIVYLSRFDGAGWLAAASRERVTHAMLVPTMLARVVSELEEGAVPAPAALRSLSYGGARIPPTVLRRALLALPGVDFVNAYGLTETSSTVAVLTPEDHRQALASADPGVAARIASVGRPLPQVEIVIRRADGSSCAPGENGQIFVRGEQVAGEYRETGRLTDADGWFATRDEGYLDRGGYLFV
ncbi:MAG TPA: class I adenylate-forming enzyme family protein, partial [Trebonia sp.]|nr:class I adenylate-forming enzyme family protein [Trebonia sp.]